MKEIIEKAQQFIITNDNTAYEIPNIKNELMSLLDGSYFSSSYATVEHNIVMQSKEKGLWLEIVFENQQNFKDYVFDRLLIQLKPKYNFLNLIRCNNEIFSGKCIFINLAKSTTEFYKKILNTIKDNYEK